MTICFRTLVLWLWKGKSPGSARRTAAKNTKNHHENSESRTSDATLKQHRDDLNECILASSRCTLKKTLRSDFGCPVISFLESTSVLGENSTRHFIASEIVCAYLIENYLYFTFINSAFAFLRPAWIPRLLRSRDTVGNMIQQPYLMVIALKLADR